MLFNNSESISNSNFELIHSDVWGPSPIASIGGSRYFVDFIDDYSCYSWIFPMKSHSEILQYTVTLQKWLKHNSLNISKLFDLIMLLNIVNILFNSYYIPMALYII